MNNDLIFQDFVTTHIIDKIDKIEDVDTIETASPAPPTHRISTEPTQQTESDKIDSKQKKSTRERLNEELTQLLEQIDPNLAARYQGCQVETVKTNPSTNLRPKSQTKKKNYAPVKVIRPPSVAAVETK